MLTFCPFQDDVFAACYSGQRTALSLTDFLTSLWLASRHDELAGYKQQDAHEFFIHMLDALGGSEVAPLPSVRETRARPSCSHDAGDQPGASGQAGKQQMTRSSCCNLHL